MVLPTIGLGFSEGIQISRKRRYVSHRDQARHNDRAVEGNNRDGYDLQESKTQIP